jgi:glycosyltransferase involved in cell wall biosynthesis
MRIGLVILLFEPGNMGGVETYLRNLISHLAQVDQENEYIILINQKAYLDLELPSPNFKKVVIQPPSNLLTLWPKRITRKLKYILVGRRHQTTFIEELLAEEISRLDLDLLHHPFGLIHPLSNSLPTALTFWDMQHEFFPEFFSEYEIQWRERHYKPSVHLAERIIVASNFTRETLTSRYGIGSERISLIYFGVGSEFQKPISPQQTAELKKRYDLSDNFIFYPAATYPHKNHIRLVQAFKMVYDKIKDVQLVLTGAAMTNEAELQAAIKDLNLEKRVRRLGFIPSGDLPVLYAAASMMVFPSLFEGYGIPLLEAMSAGCPVISSNACSLPELAGEAAMLIDPLDVEAIAEAIVCLWQDRDLANQLVLLGRRQAAKFSWPEAAKQTVEVYKAVYADKNSK